MVYDDYMTPESAWEAVKNYIPKNKIIWEGFYGDGKSGTYLKKLGFDTIHAKIDFFENDWGDVVVSNPPFSKAKEVLKWEPVVRFDSLVKIMINHDLEKLN